MNNNKNQITMEQIKQLREKTGAGVMDARKALLEALSSSKLQAPSNSAGRQNSNLMEIAEEIIKQKGIIKAESKQERETSQGLVYAYMHHNGKNGAMVKLLCETDFVARTDDFKNLAKELAMQVASMEPKNLEDFVKQEYIRDSKLTIDQLIKQTAGKVGENIRLVDFVRMSL